MNIAIDYNKYQYIHKQPNYFHLGQVVLNQIKKDAKNYNKKDIDNN